MSQWDFIESKYFVFRGDFFKNIMKELVGCHIFTYLQHGISRNAPNVVFDLIVEVREGPKDWVKNGQTKPPHIQFQIQFLHCFISNIKVWVNLVDIPWERHQRNLFLHLLPYWVSLASYFYITAQVWKELVWDGNGVGRQKGQHGKCLKKGKIILWYILNFLRQKYGEIPIALKNELASKSIFRNLWKK